MESWKVIDVNAQLEGNFVTIQKWLEPKKVIRLRLPAFKMGLDREDLIGLEFVEGPQVLKHGG